GSGGCWEGGGSVVPGLGERFVDEAGCAVARAGDAIVPGVRAFCERRGEDVWLPEGGMLRVSAAPTQDEGVEREVEAARELGVPEEAVLLEPEQLAERIRSPQFRRAVFHRDCATIQPARLARALRRAALEVASVHE